MSATSTRTSPPAAPVAYPLPARVLHWTIAVLILATVPAGQIMIQEGLSRSTQDALFIFHKNVGPLILVLMIVRLVYRLIHPPPPFPAHMPGWQQRVAAITHVLLYVLVFVMALSGYVRVRAGGFPIEYLDALGAPHLVPENEALEETAQAIHFYTRLVLVPLILLHIGAALNHALVRRDGVFQRMWRGARR